MKRMGLVGVAFCALMLSSCDVLDSKDNMEPTPQVMTKDPDEKVPPGRD